LFPRVGHLTFDAVASRIQSPFWLNQRIENIFAPMPRAFLQWLELHAAPPPVPESSWQEILSFWKGRRVAVVRQAAYRGAYPAGKKKPWPQTVLSAFSHLGPFSFLADLGADYFVVRQTPDPETHRWREKFLHDPDPTASIQAVQRWQLEQENHEGLLDCEDIPWEDYDLVVSLDVAVPARITRQTSKTIWAYFSVEAGGPLQKDSFWRPVPGYQLFLNHGFRRYRSRPFNRPHVLEFPFSFQSALAWTRLARENAPHSSSRRGTVVDKSTWGGLGNDARHAGWTPLAGDAPQYVQRMTSAKFALRIDQNRRWGNWSIEAVQAGCLFLGNPDSLAMPALLLPGLAVRNPQEAFEVVQRLEKNPDLFDSARHAQSLLAEHLAFRRPLTELTEKFRKILKP
jgi:hypothetical protein